jgi:predicted 3-demethylubiquinone-9 3-methyltransferase (glyoxalase superfamily)
MKKITPFLWFDNDAEEAVELYTSVFKNAKVHSVQRYGAGGPGKEGSVMTIHFELEGQELIALNGGPHFKHSEAFSLSVDCKSQAEVDELWARLSAGGQPGQCGWLKDRFGLSWQIVPSRLVELLGDKDRAKAARVMGAMMKMHKIDIAALERAAAQA